MQSEFRTILDKQLKNIFASAIRAEGFKGSGRNFRRINGNLIHVINVQGSQYNRSFAVNLGVHLTLLPDSIGRVVNPKKITEPSCELRRRMSKTDVDHWWSFENNLESIQAAVFDATKVYETHGKQYFECLGNYPQDFAQFDVMNLKSDKSSLCGFSNTEAILALIFARIRQHEGRKADATAFAKYGLEILGQASALKRTFEMMIITNGSKQNLEDVNFSK